MICAGPRRAGLAFTVGRAISGVDRVWLAKSVAAFAELGIFRTPISL
ncbi:hypothetical protein SAMN05444004_103278 [Jannaschia faecimaris]|uniref:Uncharacterized protein n=1 Tax=Jannaschia faecimaris TaxID=1244108 RepID=A0A1H3N5F2_9RHOB|nr:hypothetical protein [Jannaschia faecimaris]SDY84102.1 hypothetical protein SAMN05444004_103278 [Jannaschia faecimaris]